MTCSPSHWVDSVGASYLAGLRALCAALAALLLAAPAHPQTLRSNPELATEASFEVEAETDDAVGHRVVICGHLYSLYSRNKIQDPRTLIYSERYLKTFANELDALNPDVTFFLGDSVRYAKKAEWDLLARNFKDVPGKKIWVAGNHEVKGFESFREAGGVHNSSLILGRNKFIILDTKTVFEEEDLAFIEREVKDWEEYDNVFIMMHLFLIKNEVPEPGVDPYLAYSGGSNWNSSVLPLIAGKVKYIFAGDYYPKHAGRFVQRYKEHEVHYIRNAFLFRRGRGDDVTGDGPMIYLVLDFDASGKFSITPKLLPVDLRDTWYRNFGLNSDAPAYEEFEEKRTQKPEWRRLPFKHGLTIGLPRSWRMNRGKGDLMYTAWQYRNELGIRSQLFSYINSQGWNEEEFKKQLFSVAEKDRTEPLNIEREGKFQLDDGLNVNWAISESFTGEESTLSLNCYFMRKNRCFLVVYSTKEVLPDYRANLEVLVMMFDLCRQFQFAPL